MADGSMDLKPLQEKCLKFVELSLAHADGCKLMVKRIRAMLC